MLVSVELRAEYNRLRLIWLWNQIQGWKSNFSPIWLIVWKPISRISSLQDVTLVWIFSPSPRWVMLWISTKTWNDSHWSVSNIDGVPFFWQHICIYKYDGCSQAVLSYHLFILWHWRHLYSIRCFKVEQKMLGICQIHLVYFPLYYFCIFLLNNTLFPRLALFQLASDRETQRFVYIWYLTSIWQRIWGVCLYALLPSFIHHTLLSFRCIL